MDDERMEALVKVGELAMLPPTKLTALKLRDHLKYLLPRVIQYNVYNHAMLELAKALRDPGHDELAEQLDLADNDQDVYVFCELARILEEPKHADRTAALEWIAECQLRMTRLLARRTDASTYMAEEPTLEIPLPILLVLMLELCDRALARTRRRWFGTRRPHPSSPENNTRGYWIDDKSNIHFVVRGPGGFASDDSGSSSSEEDEKPRRKRARISRRHRMTIRKRSDSEEEGEESSSSDSEDPASRDNLARFG